MIVADTSVCVAYLQNELSPAHRDLFFARLRGAEQLLHPLVRGKLSMGQFDNWFDLEAVLSQQPVLTIQWARLLTDIRQRQLFGSGKTFNDTAIVLDTLYAGATLWTHDRQQHNTARELNVDLQL